MRADAIRYSRHDRPASRGYQLANRSKSANVLFAHYVTRDIGNLDVCKRKTPEIIHGEYALETLRNGLMLEARLGTNPYRVGAVWTDPDFEPKQRSVPRPRVLDILTPRWAICDVPRFGVELPTGGETTIQEHAFTSPVWCRPEGQGWTFMRSAEALMRASRLPDRAR